MPPGLLPLDGRETGSRPARPYVARPRDLLEFLLLDAWTAVLGTPPAGIDDDFFARGGGTTRVEALLARVEAATGARPASGALGPPLTIRLLADRLKDENRAALRQRCRLFAGGRPVGAGTDLEAPPFFFVHGDVGGGGFYCRGLSAALGPDVTLAALTPLGRYGPAPLASVEAMAEFHLDTVRGLQARGPYRLGGFCLGGTVAYEMACRLRDAGEQVERLVVVAAVQWSRYWRLRRFSRWLGRRLGVPHEVELAWFLAVRDALQPWYTRYDRRIRLRHVPPARLFPGPSLRRTLADAVSAVAARRGGAPRRPEAPRSAEDEERRREWRQVERVSRDHVPRRYDGTVVVLWPEDEPVRRPHEPWSVWGRVARDLEVHAIPGGHNDALACHAAAAARHLRAGLGLPAAPGA